MKQFLFLLIFSVLFFTCQKDDMPSNEDWSEEDNIFSCKVNGTEWKPEGNNLGFSDNDLDVYYEKFFLNAIQFQASKDNDNTSQFLDLFIFLKNDIVGTHKIINKDVFLDFNCGNYFIDSLKDNVITIVSIDSLNNVIEGDFKFSAESTDCSAQYIEVTSGYFKTLYRN